MALLIPFLVFFVSAALALVRSIQLIKEHLAGLRISKVKTGIEILILLFALLCLSLAVTNLTLYYLT